MKTARFSVASADLLKEIERNFNSGTRDDSPGLVMGCTLIRALHAKLMRVAERLQDPELKDVCWQLGLNDEWDGLEAARPTPEETR